MREPGRSPPSRCLLTSRACVSALGQSGLTLRQECVRNSPAAWLARAWGIRGRRLPDARCGYAYRLSLAACSRGVGGPCCLIVLFRAETCRQKCRSLNVTPSATELLRAPFVRLQISQ
ncbi:hypothetical protein GY45DRAFT_4024 [Cubamyces sp. BRFM 1775]|nr:hypothetical protein GY45DRAFT_4024 [Cubamyces sp. BRFM 1775]